MKSTISGILKSFSRWATSLRMKWRRPKPTGTGPLGLAEQDLDQLRHLVQSPQWAHYSDLVDRVTISSIEHLCTGLPHDQYLFYCGVIYACRRLNELPDTVLAKAKELKEHVDVRNRISAESEASRADTFRNTPYWDSFVRDALAAAGKPEPRRFTDLTP